MASIRILLQYPVAIGTYRSDLFQAPGLISEKELILMTSLLHVPHMGVLWSSPCYLD